MPFKMPLQTSATIFFLIFSLAIATVQSAPPNTSTGIPAAFDSATGLPLPPPQWIDPNWADPDLVLTNVMYDNLPLSEVARNLRERFQNQFDTLPMPQTFGTNWGDMTIQLQLKNVRASEVFNAMNLVFENDRTPLRWELKLDQAKHPLVQLRVLLEAAPAQPNVRQVFFVGDLIGDETSGGMTMDQLGSTLVDIWNRVYSNSPPDVIQFHVAAQLLIINGTPEQNAFIQQTLTALRQKVEWEQFKQKAARANSKTDDAKSGVSFGSGGGK